MLVVGKAAKVAVEQKRQYTMKNWLMLGLFAVAGSMLGIAAKVVIANHTAAAQPPVSKSATGA